MFVADQGTTSLPDGSLTLRVLFTALAIFIAACFVAAVYSSAIRAGLSRAVARRQASIAAIASTAWLAITAALASRGALHFSAPPTMMPLFPIIILSAIGVAFSPLGRRVAVSLPLAALVGFQSFRIVVELLMHRAYVEGLMPVQMSYSGRNFDIVTGVTAAIVALWLARGGRSIRLVAAWNTLGLALLANILVVALLSAPTPFRHFLNEPANVWITRAPWIWLPAVFVWAAIAGQAIVYRRLWIESRRHRSIRMTDEAERHRPETTAAPTRTLQALLRAANDPR